MGVLQRDQVFGPGRGVDSATAQAVRGGIRYDRNVSSRFFVSTFNDYEYDKFQSLDLRLSRAGIRMASGEGPAGRAERGRRRGL